MQVFASLLISVLMLGFKLNTVKEIMHSTERRKELKGNLVVLRNHLMGEDRASWLDDVSHDAAQRDARITAFESASGKVYTAAEVNAIETGEAMFAAYEANSACVKQVEHSATIERAETKCDAKTGLVQRRAGAR